MILSNENKSAKEIYESIELEAHFRYNKPIGEIKIFTHKLPEDNGVFRLCGKDNILSKAAYPLLYKVIGDMYSSMITRTLQADEFVIPNLEGRYLSMRTSDGVFELNPDSIQAFALESVEFYAYLPNNDVSRNHFFSILDKTSNQYDMERFEKPIKRIICDVKDHIRKTVSTDDKAFWYYIRVK